MYPYRGAGACSIQVTGLLVLAGACVLLAGACSIQVTGLLVLVGMVLIPSKCTRIVVLAWSLLVAGAGILLAGAGWCGTDTLQMYLYRGAGACSIQVTGLLVSCLELVRCWCLLVLVGCGFWYQNYYKLLRKVLYITYFQTLINILFFLVSK